MKTAVDTNVLLDLLVHDPVFQPASEQALDDSLREGPVIIAPVVYAEVAARFADPADLDAFLGHLTVQLEPFDVSTLQHAGQAWIVYTRRRRPDVQCPHCGHTITVSCPSCGNRVSWRQHLIPDFLIGAHALVRADRLLTRDRGYYRTYFPTLTLLVPGSPP